MKVNPDHVGLGSLAWRMGENLIPNSLRHMLMNVAVPTQCGKSSIVEGFPRRPFVRRLAHRYSCIGSIEAKK